MEKNWKFEELRRLLEVEPTEQYQNYWKVLSPFFHTYEEILNQKKLDKDHYFKLLKQYCNLIIAQVKHPCKFESYHVAVRSPIDYYTLGREMIRPLIDEKKSTLHGVENVKEIDQLISYGENVILFANHQIEADPQALSILLEKSSPKLAEEIIFVAGERVLTDPVAVPLSLGCHLFCIYSKKYFFAHAERAAAMRLHNQKTISEMSLQLSKGGKCIYIAPSGGRDRKGASGEIEVAPFDPQSIELMYLIGRKAKKKTHFFPLALSTHDILPPPEGLQVALGESRFTKEAPIHAYFGKKIDMENFPLSDTTNKTKKKDARTQFIYELVCKMYKSL